MIKKYLILIITYLVILLTLACNFHEIEKPLIPAENGEPETGSIYQTNNFQEPGSVENEILVRISASTPVNEIDALVPGTRVKILPFPGDVNYVLYRLNEDASSDIVLASLISTGKIQHGEINALYTLTLYEPGDFFYDEFQYAPKITDAERAWDIETGSEDIIVAVIDTGINGEHEDLEDRVLAGWDVLEGKPIPASANSDVIGHGSHVSGIIGAVGDNGIGIAGVAWNIKLIPLKIFSDGIFTTTVHISEAIIRAVDFGADVINMSLGSQLFSMAVNDAVNYAHENGVVVVTSMGNDRKSMIKYPAALPGVIAVGATNGRDEISYFSTRGSHISVSAPGESIFSLYTGSGDAYAYSSGTSMSAPFVSGLAALLLSSNPDLSPDEVRSMIEDGAEPLGEAAFTPGYGHGRVNVYNTLTMPVHNNYQSISVNVTNRGDPIGGVKVLIEDTATSTIIQSGVTSYGGIKGGVNGRIVFSHVKTGDYKVRVHMGAPLEQDLSLSPGGTAQQVSFAFDTPMVLIVNAIKDTDISVLTDELYYTQGLTAMGKYFATWKTTYYGPPTTAVVSAYDMVIWYTGKTRTNPDDNINVMTDDEIEVIKNYLDSGGRLYLCGNNIADHLEAADSDFLENYLHAEYVFSPLPYEELTGGGFLTGMDLILYLEDDDEIKPLAGATGILNSSDEAGVNHWGGLSWDTGYRLVFTTICPNEVLYSDPDTFFEDIINWLDMDN